MLCFVLKNCNSCCLKKKKVPTFCLYFFNLVTVYSCMLKPEILSVLWMNIANSNLLQ